MDVNDNAQIDTSQIDDRRGRPGGGGMGGLRGIPIPTSKGGLIVTVIMVLLALVGGGFGANSLIGGGNDSGQNVSTCTAAHPDRLDDTDCRNALYVNSIQNFWGNELPKVFGKQYQTAKTVFFSQAVDTGCGQADTNVGPFYCPADHQVYIDLNFYDELASRFGASGQFAQPYVLAHEYGHHIQSLLGTEAAVRRAQQQNPDATNRYSVMLELQADCYAGVWTKHATETTDQAGRKIFNSVSQQDINQALEAAASVGDDAIQKKMGGGVDESQFTHGSSADRQKWFTTGYSTGDPKACDTFGSAL
jgi:predicted metalloprotease